jgi:hypothetical protein
MRKIHGTARRVVITAVAAAVLAGVVGGVSFARAGGDGGQQQVLRFKEIDTAGKFVSISHTKNGGPGDEFFFSAKLVNGQNMRIGRLDAKCTLGVQHRLLCEGVMHLRGGYITLAGSVSDNEADGSTERIAVTGGTGRFDQAHGQLFSTSVSDNVSRDVLDLD